MTTLIFGVGVGFFSLASIWTIAILVCLISSRLKTPYSYIGPSLIGVSTSITTLLLMLPTRQSQPESIGDEMDEIIERRTASIIAINNHFDWNVFVIMPIFFLNSTMIWILTLMILISHHLPKTIQVIQMGSKSN
ncbi:hypothetical protein SSS_10335 [Sarcoptes scabiei]|nr:hypothetical protein SSS_10335 [Sarcoptes scabiei]